MPTWIVIVTLENKHDWITSDCFLASESNHVFSMISRWYAKTKRKRPQLRVLARSHIITMHIKHKLEFLANSMDSMGDSPSNARISETTEITRFKVTWSAVLLISTVPAVFGEITDLSLLYTLWVCTLIACGSTRWWGGRLGRTRW